MEITTPRKKNQVGAKPGRNKEKSQEKRGETTIHQAGADKSGPIAFDYSEERFSPRQDLGHSDRQLIFEKD